MPERMGRPTQLVSVNVLTADREKETRQDLKEPGHGRGGP